MPFAPRSFDVWTLGKVVGLIEEARATNPDFRALALLNRADAIGGDNTAAAQIIADQPALELLPVSLGNRKAYARAATSGLGAAELRPADKKAVEEVEALFRLVARA